MLSHTGKPDITTYDTFNWREAIQALAADADNGIKAQAAIPGEDRYDLETLFTKFDEQFRVYRCRTIKRQEFLSTTLVERHSVISFTAELKKRTEYCDYGDRHV